jgi:pimeloyl-ACP methyl ester carboxylesterase
MFLKWLGGTRRSGGREVAKLRSAFLTLGGPRSREVRLGECWVICLRTDGLGTFSGRLDRLLALDHAFVGDKGRTIAHLHEGRRPRAVVLLHGMTASPAQFSRYAGDLFARGHNVLVPRLPRHGHSDRFSKAAALLTGDELMVAAREVLAVGRELGEVVTVAGFSLGGLLAAWLAQHEPIDRAVAVSPFFGVAFLPSGLMGVVAEAVLRLPNSFQWWDPILRERQMPAHGYPQYSTHAIAQSYRVARVLLQEASANAPLARKMVLVNNASESAVNNRAIRRLAATWQARRDGDVERIVLHGLPPSHDIIEPLRSTALADRVYPLVLEAIDPAATR